MRIYPCTTEAPSLPEQEEFPLNWEQVIKKDGIYQPKTYRGLYIIVLVSRHTFGGLGYQAICLNAGTIAAASRDWNNDAYRFKEVSGAKLCMEIKEAK